MAHKGYATTQAAGPRRHQDEGFQGAHQERVSRPSPTLRACIRAHKRVVVVVAVVVATKSLLLVRPYRRYHYRTTTSAAALLPSPSSIARLPNPPRPPPQASLLLSLVPPCRILIIYNLASRQPQTKPLAATDHCAIRLPSWCCSITAPFACRLGVARSLRHPLAVLVLLVPRCPSRGARSWCASCPTC